MNDWNQQVEWVRSQTQRPEHHALLDDLEAARTNYLKTRDLRVLLALASYERALLGPYIVPLSEKERANLIGLGLEDVPEATS